MKTMLLFLLVLGAVVPGAVAAAAPLHPMLVAQIQRYSGDQGFTVGFGSVWVGATNGGESVTRVDLKGHPIKEIAAPATDYVELAAGPTAIWMSDFGANLVRRIDPRTNRVSAVVRGLPGPSGFGFSGSHVFVALHHGQAVVELDGGTGRVLRRYPVPSPGGGVTAGGPTGVSLGYGAIWTAVPNLQGVVRIDRRSGATRLLRPGRDCGGVIVAGGGVWFSCGGLIRIDPGSGRATARVRADGAPALLDGRLWIAGSAGRLVAIDARTGSIAGSGRIPGVSWDPDAAFLAASGHLWAWDANHVRIDEIGVSS
jgi:outer membrane protein assembly factor BamB